jgi:hypothetical protein
MRRAIELRTEAKHLRTLAKGITDTIMLAEILKMVEELERLARQLDNGGATE